MVVHSFYLEVDRPRADFTSILLLLPPAVSIIMVSGEGPRIICLDSGVRENTRDVEEGSALNVKFVSIAKINKCICDSNILVIVRI